MTRTTASIRVDLKNPGQVLACVGFIEAAEVLLRSVEAHFHWRGKSVQFILVADSDRNPFEVVLDFLASAKIVELIPIGYVEGGAADGDDEDDAAPAESEDENGGEFDDTHEDVNDIRGRRTTPTFPSGDGERNALPIQLTNGAHTLPVSHWADSSSRNDFKLYSGNRSARRIATQMLQGVRSKRKKSQLIGDLKNLGVQQLLHEHRAAVLEAPFDVVTPMGGSFNFDPRGAWTAIDAGYSPNTQKDGIAASPVLELLAAVGLEHARPDEYEIRKVRYAVWGHPLPAMLARAALSGADLKVPTRRFEFELDLAGKNKIATFAQEETQR
jgi:CRISPR-associated protein Csb3